MARPFRRSDGGSEALRAVRARRAFRLLGAALAPREPLPVRVRADRPRRR